MKSNVMRLCIILVGVWLLQKAPNVLVLHLKRFTNTRQKIKGHVLFEADLEFTPYMSTDAADGYVP